MVKGDDFMYEKLNKERLGQIVLNLYGVWKVMGDKKLTSAVKHNINSDSEELESRFVFDLLTKNLDDMIATWEDDLETEHSEYEILINEIMKMEGVSNIEDLHKIYDKFREENLHQRSNLSKEEEEEIDRKLEERLRELQNK